MNGRLMGPCSRPCTFGNCSRIFSKDSGAFCALRVSFSTAMMRESSGVLIPVGRSVSHVQRYPHAADGENLRYVNREWPGSRQPQPSLNSNARRLDAPRPIALMTMRGSAGLGRWAAPLAGALAAWCCVKLACAAG
jgi:hypothetical protein